MYYWGSGGLSRNIKMAFKYYKMAADSGDPSSLYDYGIILLKVYFRFCGALKLSEHHIKYLVT